MAIPYFHAMQFLSLIRGPLVDDWGTDQVEILTDRATRNNNPIPRNNGTHWTELETASDAAFTDMAKQQNAHAALQQLTMRGDELDSYISMFKHLASRAGYALTEAGTVHLFALGLKSKLMDTVLHRDTQPTTFDEWVTAAKTELQKYKCRLAFKNPASVKYQWARPYHPID